MLKIATETKLSSEEVIKKAVEFFVTGHVWLGERLGAITS